MHQVMHAFVFKILLIKVCNKLEYIYRTLFFADIDCVVTCNVTLNFHCT